MAGEEKFGYFRLGEGTEGEDGSLSSGLSSGSSLLVKLSQVFESALLDSILKLAVIPVACAPFPTQILPSSQLCI